MRKRKSQFVYHLFLLASLMVFSLSASLLYFHVQERAHLAYAAETILPREYLKLRAQEYDLNYELLHRIVSCESGWRMVKNRSSSAFGYFQIIDGTERTTPQYKEGLRKFNPYVNIDMGVYLFRTSGSSPWNESYKCWRWALPS